MTSQSTSVWPRKQHPIDNRQLMILLLLEMALAAVFFFGKPVVMAAVLAAIVLPVLVFSFDAAIVGFIGFMYFAPAGIRYGYRGIDFLIPQLSTPAFLGIIVLALLIRMLRGHTIRLYETSIDKPLIAFLVLVQVYTAYGFVNSNSESMFLFNDFQNLTMFVFIFIFVQMFQENPKWMKRFFYLMMLGAIGVGLISIFIAVSGMLPPGARGGSRRDTFLLFAFIGLLAYILWEDRMLIKGILTGGFFINALGIILSQNRSLWICCLFATGILLYLYAKSAKNQVRYIVLFLLVVGGVSFLGVEMVDRSYQSTISERFTSIAEAERQTSVLMRLVSYFAVAEQIAERPIIGHGLGHATKYTLKLSILTLKGYDTWIDNIYLVLWMKMGILGLLLYLYMTYKVMMDAMFVFRNAVETKVRVYGAIVFSSFCGYLLWGMVNAVQLKFFYTFFFAMIMAITVNLAREIRRDPEYRLEKAS